MHFAAVAAAALVVPAHHADTAAAAAAAASAASAAAPAASAAAAAACACSFHGSTGHQGLTLVHFSAQREHLLWDMLGGFSVSVNQYVSG